MAEDSKEIQTVPRTKSSLWRMGISLGGLKHTLITQRRQSTRIITDMVHNIDHVIEGDGNMLASTLHWFEKATHINRRYLIVAVFLFAVSYLSLGRNAGTLCNILGMIYPIYASIKASEKCCNQQREHWLRYWIVYSIINVLEIALEMFLVWLPMYYLLKFIFLAWCMAPITANGSHVMYASIIRPLFHEHNEKVESALSAVTQHLTAEKEVPMSFREALNNDAGEGLHQRSLSAAEQEDE
ncbi:receptor expression-enhancing protein 5-like [Dendronephthya gigantea]|uniref:receptor expression-enhancing protein 5-like n=1 Tax=Dendronephthya gigantea TaxID=151771 RepID=UPI00106976EA|nr:receptor expression-enhancing protein 5-like [Dendronephthya gigantea]